MVRPLARAIVLLCLAVATAGAQSFQVVDPFEEDGAYSLIIVPQHWNGGLFIYAHGYTADERTRTPYPSDITPANLATTLDRNVGGADRILQIPLTFGYAAATTTYRSVGWAVEDAVQDIENIRRRFITRYGEPRYTYIWGHSEGGMVTQTVIEKVPAAYDGALAMCAPGAGARRNFNAAFDLRAAFEYVCRGVPGAEFVCNRCSDAETRCLHDEDCGPGETCGGPEPAPDPAESLTAACTEFLLRKPERQGEFVDRPVDACIGRDAPTPEQAARRELLVRGTQVAADDLRTDMFYTTIAAAEIVHRRTHGHHPWSNVGVTYAPTTLLPAEISAFNAGVPRVQNDPDATHYLRAFYEPEAATGTRVLSLHAVDDPLVIPENTEKYREAFTAAGRPDQLVEFFTTSGGHCGFSGAEHLAAFLALTGWIEAGTVPTVTAAEATCQGFVGLAGGPCRLETVAIGEWGARIVERRQLGVPPELLFCEGDPGDCPVGSVCSPVTHRCRPAGGYAGARK